MKQIAWIGGMLGIIVFAGACTLFQDAHVKQGHELFLYYCAHCHGDGGKGNGYNAKNIDPKPRDLTDSREKYIGEQSNEDIYTTLSRDIKEESESKDTENWVPATMPTFKYTLSDLERWEIVAYVRTLQKNDAGKVDFTKPLESKLPPIKVEPLKGFAELASNKKAELAAQGQHLFEKKFVCLSCHTVNGKGGQVGPDLSRSGFRLNPAWIYKWIKSPQMVVANSAGLNKTKMPNFGMTDDEALAITAYLNTLNDPGPPSSS